MALKFPQTESRSLPEEFWWNGEWYHSIDAEAKCLHGYRNQTASCGCCSETVDTSLDWEMMDENEQTEVYQILGLEVQE